MSYDRMFLFLRHAGIKMDGERPVNLSVRKVDGGDGARLVSVCGKVYMVWDNGGEVGVHLLNTEYERFFPLTAYGAPLSEGTLYLRLCAVIREESIDYDETLAMTVEELVGHGVDITT